MGRFATHELRNSLVVVVVSVVVFAVVALVRRLLWQPLRMRRTMIKQGVAAAPFHFLVGSLPECFAYAAKFSGDLHVDDHYDSTPTVSPMNILYFPKNGMVASSLELAHPVSYFCASVQFLSLFIS